MTFPRLAYAANRWTGARGLRALLEEGWTPVVLVLADTPSEPSALELQRMLPGVPVLGLRFHAVVHWLA